MRAVEQVLAMEQEPLELPMLQVVPKAGLRAPAGKAKGADAGTQN